LNTQDCVDEMNMEQPINTIEIRKAKNGYVVSCFMARTYEGNGEARGYVTYVVQSEDPEEIGRAVAKALQDHAITLDVVIPPARPVA
jgi:hypothetical protein